MPGRRLSIFWVGFIALTSALAVLLVIGARYPRSGAGSAASLPKDRPQALVDRRGSLYVTNSQLAALRKNVKRYVWARRAWQNSLAFANDRLGATASAPDPNRDYSHDAPARPNWRDDLYAPGIADGHTASGLAIAYRVTGTMRYADAAKRVLLGWVRTYTHPPGYGGGVQPGHMVAEPIGPMIKLFLAADLLWPALNGAERSEVSAWAAQWVPVGERNADLARDAPWVPDTTIGGFVSNQASYGNSAMGQRAMALWAAAVAGPRQLAAALDWNFGHLTPGGRPYGWDDIVAHLIIPGTGGETIEGRDRQSVGYGLFAWGDLLAIADLASHAGFTPNLFTRAAPNGSTLLSAGTFYGPLLAGANPYPYKASETFAPTYDQVRAEYRAVFETAYRNCPKGLRVCRSFKAAVAAGGVVQRGNNYDFHLVRWNALLGRP